MGLLVQGKGSNINVEKEIADFLFGLRGGRLPPVAQINCITESLTGRSIFDCVTSNKGGGGGGRRRRQTGR